MKNSLCIIFILFFSFNVNAAANKQWYGLLTTDTFPLSGCKVLSFTELNKWYQADNARVSVFADAYLPFKKEIKEDLMKAGWNAVLGFNVDYIGGAGGFNSGPVYMTGMLTFTGVAVDVKCK
mgnify:CR=1 FL=1